MTNCPAVALTLNAKYTACLEVKERCQAEHEKIKDLHDTIARGIQFQHKWSRHHKYLLASVDVKDPHVSFSDLVNSVPPEESHDELLDQSWDDHTGSSLDTKKVKDSKRT